MTSDLYPENLDELLDRFVAGDCTRAEIDIVMCWLDADPAPPARQERVERFRRLWVATHRSGGDEDAWDIDRAWRRAAGRMTPARILTLTPRAAGRRGRGGWSLAVTRLVAAIAVIVAGAVMVRAFGLGASAHRKTGDLASIWIASREYLTGPGERMTLTLTDGTRVTLGPASRLSLPANYDRARERVVAVQGDAYLEVTHDPAKPFAVRAGRTMVRDIGTKFLVRSYGTEQPVTVVVTEGEVQLAGASLRQGDWGRFDSNGTVRVRHDTDLQSYTSWTNGPLVFSGMPLSEAIPVLEHWYDLEITVEDQALYDRRLSATLGTEPVSRVIDLVALALNLHIDREGRRVRLSR